jgi:hypothetical protein
MWLAAAGEDADAEKYVAVVAPWNLISMVDAKEGNMGSSSELNGSKRKPELEQLPMNAWRAPKHIFNAHPPDQCSQIGTDLRASSQVPRFATPVAAKTGAAGTPCTSQEYGYQ